MDHVISLLKFDNLLAELESSNDFEERVRMTLQAITHILPIKIKCEQKDSEKSKSLRNEMDKIFVKRKGDNKVLFEALYTYNKCIAIAENSSLELAQAYANKSAILYHLDKLDECIKNIDRALELPYPDHLRANLLRRKAKCLRLLDKKDFDKVCEEARQWLENMTVSEAKKEKMELKIVYISKQLQTKSQLEQVEESQKVSLPQIIPNPKIPSASEAIRIEYNDEFGKHLIANRDIEVGEILIIEKPYAWILSTQNIYTHCAHCFKRVWDSIPCENCIHSIYCSEKCKNEAWQQYHDVECSVRAHLISLKMNDLVLLSFKLAILAVRESGNIRKLKRILKKIDSQDYLIKSFSEDGIYHSDEYRPLYSLLTHEQKRRRYDLLAISLNTAVTLYYLFSLTSFVGCTSDDVFTLCKNKDAMFLGKLIARHHMLIHINDHQFTEVFNRKFVSIGTVIGSVMSLLNHSCNPNVGRFSRLQDSTLQQVVHALHPIQKGSQIFDDYGFNFATTLKSEREINLQKFYFKCTCIACNKNWPLFKNLPSILPIVTDKEKKLEVVRAIIRSKIHSEIITEFEMHNYSGDKTEILPNFINSIRIIYEVTSEPNKEFIEILELFSKAFVLLHGNFFEL